MRDRGRSVAFAGRVMQQRSKFFFFSQFHSVRSRRSISVIKCWFCFFGSLPYLSLDGKTTLHPTKGIEEEFYTVRLILFYFYIRIVVGF